MANVWFISDLHLDHKNICTYRTQFSSVMEHNEFIKDRYHSVVTKRDKVFFLGDVAFSRESLADVATWVGEQKAVIVGNHDLERGITMRDVCDAFDSVYALLKYKEFWLSHAPIHKNELRGKKNIHGHMHYDVIPDHSYMNVCLEHINFTPISLAEVRETFRKMEICN